MKKQPPNSEELSEQLRLSVVAAEISIDPQQAEPYHRECRDAFSSLCECQKVWKATEHRAVNQSTGKIRGA